MRIFIASCLLVLFCASSAMAGAIGSGGVKSITKADYQSGVQFYRVSCNSYGSKVVGKKSNGWWVDSGYAQFGESYKGLSLSSFADKACR